MKIRITIIDDNKSDLEKMSSVIEESFTDDIVVDNMTNLSTNMDFSQVDLFVVDIDMPGKNGFEVANIIYKKQPNAKIVFCTNHNDLVYSTFPYSPFYFVRKNHLNQDMNLMAEKFRKQLGNKYIHFSKNNETIKILVQDVVYIESYRNYSELHLNNKETIKIRKTLKEYEYLLMRSFCFINKSQLVNFDYVKMVKGIDVYLMNGELLSISRLRKKQVQLQYQKYLMEK